MIKAIHFENFKVLRSATLPLGRFTLIVGPNGSGKSTALSAFRVWADAASFSHELLCTVGSTEDVCIQIDWETTLGSKTAICWNTQGHPEASIVMDSKETVSGRFNQLVPRPEFKMYRNWISNSCIYALDPRKISAVVALRPVMELAPDGSGLAGVLDSLRDQEPERYEKINTELSRWLPEYDRILFSTPKDGSRIFALRTTDGHGIEASDLSDGTLLALAILTIAYLPIPPNLVAFEDPDQGLHPRLLGQVQEALYRLAYPERFGDDREPVQVIATTHSPYFLDLFKDSPEEIVIAEKSNGGATFSRLSDHPHIEDILQDAPLGEVWYSGVLGGVPAES